jgi:hypothetical protein
MALSKTWYTSANLALADTSTVALATHSSLWALGAMLLGYQSGTDGPEGARPGSVAWTLVGSSNSTTYGIDSTDRLHFSGSFTAADWVKVNYAGSAHTWFVLKSPSGLLDGPWYLCVDYISAYGDPYCTFVISKNVFSGGSTTARPTSTNESVVSDQQICSSSTGAGKTHLAIDANGGFRWLRSRNATGYFDFFLSVEPLVEYHSGDAARTFLLAHFYDGGTGALTVQQSPTVRGLCSDGTTALTYTYCGICELMQRPSGQPLSQYNTTNALDATVDALPCVYMYDNNTSHKGIRGRYPDMWEVGAQVAVGSTFPGSGNPERVLVGSRMIGFSVAPSL